MYLGKELNSKNNQRQKKKYLFCFLPLAFIGAFFMSLDTPHQGTLSNHNCTYVGQVYKGEPNGQGRLTYVNGDFYLGHFDDGKFNGQGTFSSRSGHWHFKGEFKNGSATGEGALFTADGKQHRAQFQDGMIQKEDSKQR